MRFAENGYYIESYVKCDNCGVLIYDEGLMSGSDQQRDLVFCTHWCIEWHAQAASGVAEPVVDGDFNA
jgi:hypothetical protein